MKRLCLLTTVPALHVEQYGRGSYSLVDSFPKFTPLNTIINGALGRDCSS